MWKSCSYERFHSKEMAEHDSSESGSGWYVYDTPGKIKCRSSCSLDVYEEWVEPTTESILNLNCSRDQIMAGLFAAGWVPREVAVSAVEYARDPKNADVSHGRCVGVFASIYLDNNWGKR